MKYRFKDYQHILRMAAIFALGITAFFVLRAAMVPKDFGVYGHYRAGALKDNAARQIQYAGRAACVDCHGEIQQARAAGKHAGIGCESCHGPLARHAAGEMPDLPQKPHNRETCLRCHTSRPSKPAGFPQIVPADHPRDHPRDRACTACHPAHNPKV
jgi:hypothetical protein